MDVWCEAFCCRRINFKTVFQSASEHAVFIQKIEKFSGEGHSTPTGRGKPPPTPCPFGAYGVSTHAPLALNHWRLGPLSKILNTPPLFLYQKS